MPPIVPLVLTAGAAIRGLRARNRRIDAEEATNAQEEDAAMRRQLADSEKDDDDDEPAIGQVAARNTLDSTATATASKSRSSVPSPSRAGGGRPRGSRSQSRPSVGRRKSSADSSAGKGKKRSDLPDWMPSETSSDEEHYIDVEQRRSSAQWTSSSALGSSRKRDSTDLGASRRTSTTSTVQASTIQQRRRESAGREEVMAMKGQLPGQGALGPLTSSSRTLRVNIPSRDLGVQAYNGTESESDVATSEPAINQGHAGKSRYTDSPSGLGSGDEDEVTFAQKKEKQRSNTHLQVPNPKDARKISVTPEDSLPPITPIIPMSSRPSAQHSAHHWQRFYNLVHPNFLNQQTSGTKNFPKTATRSSDAPSSGDELSRHGPITPVHGGRGARRYGRGTGVASSPAVSFQHEVSVGGRLLHPQMPSILRSRPGAVDSSIAETPATATASDARAQRSRSGLSMRRTATAESDLSMSVDGTEYSGEDEDDVADRILGRSRKEVPRMLAGRGQGRGKLQPENRPSRAFSTMILAGGGIPLRGWARRRREREQDEAELDGEGEGDGDGDVDAKDVEEGRAGGNNGAGMSQDGMSQTDGGQEGRDGEEEDDADSEDEEAKVQIYRKTPIISGILAPFSIMLEVPGFTSSWYISTGRELGNVVYEKNPVLLDIGLAFSMAFAVLANLCIILRFLEVMRPKKSTLIAMVLLTLHDSINVAALAIFGKAHAVDDGFTYSEGYWMTLGSTLASIIVNFTLIADYINTKQFRDAGSGLTRKQRELVIMTMLVLFYLSIGALIYCLLLKINFETALYFVVCTLFTIGFGDITPKTTASRIVLFVYAPIGIVLIALVIATTRETILEQFEQSYKQRRLAVKQRYIERQEAKRVNRQLRLAVRLRQVSVGRGGGRQWITEDGQMLANLELALPVLPMRHREEEEKKDTRLGKLLDAARAFVETGFSQGWKKDPNRGSVDAEAIEKGKQKALVSELQRSKAEGAAVPDMGAGLAMLAGTLIAPARAGTAMMSPKVTDAWMEMEKRDLKANEPTSGGSSTDATDSLGEKENPSSSQASDGAEKDPNGINTEGIINECDTERGPRHDDRTYATEEQQADEMALMESSLRKHREELEKHWEEFKHEVVQQERNEFVAKMVVSGSLFLVFWLMGAGIFVATEGWNFFEGLYFGFVFFSTIGYGDFSPTTPSGRAFFIVWALFGVGILTVIFSVLGDAWGTIYKNTLADSRRKYGWKARWRQRRESKRGERGGKQGDSGQSADPTKKPTAEDVDPDQSQEPGSVAGSADHGAEETPGIPSIAPSDGGDAVDEGGMGDQESSIGNGLRNRIRRSNTFGSIGGPGGLESTTPTTGNKRRQPVDQIPLQLARAAMHLHSEASHLLESQRHVLAESVSSAPSLHRRLRRQLRVVAAGGKLQRGAVSAALAAAAGLGAGEEGEDGDGTGTTPGPGADEEEIHRYELEKLELAAVSALEREGDFAGMAAVRQLFALVQYDSHLTAVIENSHALRETLVGQERELVELRARVEELEADAEEEIEERLDVDEEGRDGDEVQEKTGGNEGGRTRNDAQP
ncbi:hypothetical protein A4X09_0g248 [Tilletia walkeri]|uniref:Potassium channel domain-containing protein n=1 Tax=Tilletia walkeri TaxID=117179 RepID=A0A8X7NH67_9BASI|nr:hypothetical protein A4X09_0g248 [Tilletia walkeri]